MSNKSSGVFRSSVSHKMNWRSDKNCWQLRDLYFFVWQIRERKSRANGQTFLLSQNQNKNRNLSPARPSFSRITNMKVEKNLSRFDSRDRKGKMHEMNGTKKPVLSLIFPFPFLSRDFAGYRWRFLVALTWGLAPGNEKPTVFRGISRVSSSQGRWMVCLYQLPPFAVEAEKRGDVCGRKTKRKEYIFSPKIRETVKMLF